MASFPGCLKNGLGQMCLVDLLPSLGQLLARTRLLVPSNHAQIMQDKDRNVQYFNAFIVLWIRVEHKQVLLTQKFPHSTSLVPRLSRNANMYRVESLVSFLCKHDVIKIRQKQKDNVYRVVQPTMLLHSVCMIFDAR